MHCLLSVNVPAYHWLRKPVACKKKKKKCDFTAGSNLVSTAFTHQPNQTIVKTSQDHRTSIEVSDQLFALHESLLVNINTKPKKSTPGTLGFSPNQTA